MQIIIAKVVTKKNLCTHRFCLEPKEAFNINKHPLFNADPNCQHEIETLWSGVKCKKCPGWFCY